MSQVEYLDAVEDDPQKRKPDIRRAKELLNWEPKVRIFSWRQAGKGVGCRPRRWVRVERCSTGSVGLASWGPEGYRTVVGNSYSSDAGRAGRWSTEVDD